MSLPTRLDKIEAAWQRRARSASRVVFEGWETENIPQLKVNALDWQVIALLLRDSGSL